jgi:hypothetical protein
MKHYNPLKQPGVNYWINLAVEERVKRWMCDNLSDARSHKFRGRIYAKWARVSADVVPHNGTLGGATKEELQQRVTKEICRRYRVVDLALRSPVGQTHNPSQRAMDLVDNRIKVKMDGNVLTATDTTKGCSRKWMWQAGELPRTFPLSNAECKAIANYFHRRRAPQLGTAFGRPDSEVIVPCEAEGRGGE